MSAGSWDRPYPRPSPIHAVAGKYTVTPGSRVRPALTGSGAATAGPGRRVPEARSTGERGGSRRGSLVQAPPPPESAPGDRGQEGESGEEPGRAPAAGVLGSSPTAPSRGHFCSCSHTQLVWARVSACVI